jgi:hypothetical protein
MDLEGMRRFVGADSLAFLSVDGTYRAMGYPGRNMKQPQFTDHCYRRLSDAPRRPVRRSRAPAIVAFGGGKLMASPEDLDQRIAIVRDNLRELTEQAAAYSGAQDESLAAGARAVAFGR